MYANGKARSDSVIYVKRKTQLFEDVGIKHDVIRIGPDRGIDKIKALVDEVNESDKMHGIMVQLPVPKVFGLDKCEVDGLLDMIKPEKDIDGLNSDAFERDGLLPCTTVGILSLMDYYNIGIEGKRIVIVGRGMLVGMPLSHALERLKDQCEIITCDENTEDIQSLTRSADIIVVGVGHARLITAEYITPDTVVLDVGINREKGKDGKVRVIGDVHPSVYPLCKYYTPVPNGIGLLTVASLAVNSFKAYEKQVMK